MKYNRILKTVATAVVAMSMIVPLAACGNSNAIGGG